MPLAPVQVWYRVEKLILAGKTELYHCFELLIAPSEVFLLETDAIERATEVGIILLHPFVEVAVRKLEDGNWVEIPFLPHSYQHLHAVTRLGYGFHGGCDKELQVEDLIPVHVQPLAQSTHR